MAKYAAARSCLRREEPTLEWRRRMMVRRCVRLGAQGRSAASFDWMADSCGCLLTLAYRALGCRRTRRLARCIPSLRFGYEGFLWAVGRVANDHAGGWLVKNCCFRRVRGFIRFAVADGRENLGFTGEDLPAATAYPFAPFRVRGIFVCPNLPALLPAAASRRTATRRRFEKCRWVVANAHATPGSRGRFEQGSSAGPGCNSTPRNPSNPKRSEGLAVGRSIASSR